MMDKRAAKSILWPAVFLVAQLWLVATASGQNLIAGDPSDTFDPEAMFINPGVIPFQHRQVMVGMKIYQLGFLKISGLGLHSSYFSLSLPEEFLGFINLGLTGQNFSVPLYDQTNFSLLLAKRALERLSIGFKYNLFTKSYHQKYFDLVDPNDPVFADGTTKVAHSFGAGIILFPWSTLSIGFSCDHLNRPDVSLFHDRYQQPLVYDFGLRYSWRYFSSSIFFNRFQQHWQLNWVFESRPFDSGIIKLGVVQRAAKLSAQMNIMPGLALDYAFDYPFYEINQLSHGSHQISLIYDLDHRDKIKQLQVTSFSDGKFPIFNLSSQFFVEIEDDELEIISQKINRHVEPGIPESALNNLTEVEMALHDSGSGESQLYEHGYLANVNLASLGTAAKYSPKYEAWLAANLLSKKIDSLRLITNPSTLPRATQLRAFLVEQAPDQEQQLEIRSMAQEPLTSKAKPDELHCLTQEQYYTLNPESVSFQISSIKMRKYKGVWKLIISDSADREIKSFVMKGRVPKALSWDWRDNGGNIIKPDIYYYYIQWEIKPGQWQRTQPQLFSVVKVSRTLNIDIRSNPGSLENQGRIVEIKFAN